MSKNTRKRNINTVGDIVTITKKQKYRTKIKEPSIIYFVVLCHGEVNFTKNANNTYDPININIPPKISFFNKITFAPLGIYNIMNDNDSNNILEELKTEIPKLYSKQEGYGDVLADKLKNDYSQLLNPSNDLKTQTNPYTRGYLHILNNNKEQYYQSVVYDVNNKNNNIPIIQKLFSLDDKVNNNDSNDILVVFQKGGLLKTGDKILNNNRIFKDYMVNLWKEKITDNIDKDGNYIYVPKITTDELLEISVEYGYEKVVIIDYSCDYCRNVVDTSDKIPRDIIRKWREDVKKRKFSRGGKINRKTKKFIKKLKF